MANTLSSDVISVPLMQEALAGWLSQKNAILGGELAAMGAAVVQLGLVAKAPESVSVPYFGSIGKGAKYADGATITPVKLQQGKETSTVQRFGHGVSHTTLANMVAQGDLNAEAARQLITGVMSAMDDELVAVAQAPGALLHTAASVLTYAEIVKAQGKFGADQSGFAGMVVHPVVMSGLRLATDGFNRPLFADLATGEMSTISGLKLAQSDKCATQSAMGAVTSPGPVVTLSGTPNSYIDLVIRITLGGAVGTAKFKFSTDGGSTFSAEITTAASVPLIDTAIASVVGIEGTTGITAAFAAGTYVLDHSYTAKSTTTFKSLLLKKNSLALWLNDQALISSGIKVDEDPATDSLALFINAYAVTHRYRSLVDSRLPGVCVINSTG